MRKWISTALAVLLVLTAGVLIAQRLIPVGLEDLMPVGYCPEQCGVMNTFEWNESVQLTQEQMQTLLEHLDALEYRYDGRTPGGVMKGVLYHLSFFQRVENGTFDLFVTTQLGVVYADDKVYEMMGDTKPLLEFLSQLY